MEAMQFYIFVLTRLMIRWNKGKKFSPGSVSENKRKKYDNVQPQLFPTTAAASVKNAGRLKLSQSAVKPCLTHKTSLHQRDDGFSFLE